MAITIGEKIITESAVRTARAGKRIFNLRVRGDVDVVDELVTFRVYLLTGVVMS